MIMVLPYVLNRTRRKGGPEIRQGPRQPVTADELSLSTAHQAYPSGRTTRQEVSARPCAGAACGKNAARWFGATRFPRASARFLPIQNPIRYPLVLSDSPRLFRNPTMPISLHHSNTNGTRPHAIPASVLHFLSQGTSPCPVITVYSLCAGAGGQGFLRRSFSCLVVAVVFAGGRRSSSREALLSIQIRPDWLPQSPASARS